MWRLGFILLLVASWLATAQAGERETLGPSNRRAAIIISEVMYHPLEAQAENLEFVELYNAGLQPVPLAGWRLSGDISFVFPAGPVLQPGAFLVVAAAPTALANRYGLSNLLGPYTNALPNEGGTIRLRNAAGAVLWEVDYDDAPPWPVTADGAGHSLVLARPSFGEGDPRAWEASAVRGGSPGGPEPAYSASSFEDLVLNEIGTVTNRFGDPPFVEVYNRGGGGLLFGASSPLFLTDDPQTNKIRLSTAGLNRLGARSAAALSLTSLGLSPKPGGGALYLIDTAQNRVLDMVRYSDQSPPFAFGRFPDGATRWGTVTPTPFLTPLPSPDPGQRPSFRSDVVINEIMYHPISGSAEDEYVELFNRHAQSAVDVSGWKFIDGIDLTLPIGSMIPPNGYLVVAKNAQRLRTNYAGLVNVVGDYAGQLSDRGERLALAKPEPMSNASGNHLAVGDNITYVVMDEVTYGTGGAWGRWSDGGGASLELASPEGDNDCAGHWRDSAEPQNTPWTTLRESGPMEFGETRSTPNAVELLLFGEGECLIDNVEVLVNGVNRVSNGTLDFGAGGWVFEGTHDASGWRATGGVGNSGCLHLRATAHGDTYANRVYVPLTITVPTAQQITLGAQVRHLRGNLDVLLRVRGNWSDAGATMTVAPGAYGSPGRANAAAATPTPTAPAIYDVGHHPILPNANQSVIVTARFDGARSNTSFSKELLYRVDPSVSYLTLILNDDGTNGDAIAGDGLWSATIPGQPAGQLVAFRIRARYVSPAATNFFPSPQPLYPGDTFGRECLVRFGDARPTGSFTNYRLWMTQATHNRWSTRGPEHHSPLDTTFVYADQRVIYTVDSAYAGAEFIYDTPTGIICGYNLGFPPDERLLGAREMLLDWGQSDDVGQRENVGFWIAEQMGLPFLHRRHVTLAVNGLLPAQRPLTGYHPLSAKVYWDAQEPNGDFVKQWFPDDDNEGELYKLHHLVFGSDPGNVYGFHLFRFRHFIDTAGQRHQAAYRWHWRRRGADRGASDLGAAFRLLDAVNAPDAGYVPNVEGLVNVNQWMRTFAFERVIGNLDSLGWDNGHNMYGYFSPQLGWHLLPYDCELSLATPTGTWYDTSPTKDLFSYWYDDGEFKGDHTLGRMKQNPAFQRAYWRAFYDAINGPLVTANFLPVMQRYQAALAANGVSVAGPAVMQGYLETRREYIRSQLATVNASFTVTSPPDGATLNTNLVTITGSAPIQAAVLSINHVPQSVRWTSLTTWSLSLALPPGAQTLLVQALDGHGQAIDGMSATLHLQLNAPSAAPETNIVINEIMYHSAIPQAEFLELHNRSGATAFDLSGWRINGLDFAFPTGSSIAPGGFAVVVADRLVFGQTYGFDIPVAGVFAGSFDAGGETLTLRRPVGTDEWTVDTVTYEDDLPWPTAADGGGPSLQLIDSTLDNNRVGHWTAVTNASAAGSTNLLISMTATWKYRDDGIDLQTAWRQPAYDDGAWPAGAALLHYEPDPLPAPKNTLLRLGPTTYYFRRPFWIGDIKGVTLRLTTIIDDGAIVYLNGEEAFRLGGPPGPMAYNTFSDRNISEATVEGPFDLPITNLLGGDNLIAVEVHQRTNTSSDVAFGLALEAIPPLRGGGGLRFTPGAPNQVPASGAFLPLVWLNELQVINATGPSDGRSQREPWLEIYNAGSALDLTGFFLSNDPSNLTRFPLPAGSILGPGQFKLVWLDGDFVDHTPAEWHANFRLKADDTILLLSRQAGERIEVVDYLTFVGLKADQAVARVPDGAAGRPSVLDYATAGTANSGAAPLPAIYINEFLAANTLWPDPADGDADDFVELYNAMDRTVSLAGYTLTDRLGIPRKFVVPDGVTIGPRSFVLAWADEEEGQTQSNAELHLNFKLNDAGEVIALFAPDGRLVDSYAFGLQAANTSLARWPDGLGPFSATTNATPGMRNKLNGFTPPPLTVEAELQPNGGVKIYFTASHRASVVCTDRLRANANWSQVNGQRGYDALTDREWILDQMPSSTGQRFYQALRLR